MVAKESDEHLDVETRCVRKEATDLTGCCSGIERQEMARQSRAEEGKDCWRKRPGCFLRTCGEGWVDQILQSSFDLVDHYLTEHGKEAVN